MEIKIDQIKIESDELAQESKSILALRNSVSWYKDNLAISGWSKYQIRTKLKDIADSMKNSEFNLISLGLALDKISDEYVDTERKIVNLDKSNEKSKDDIIDEVKKSISNFADKFVDNFTDAYKWKITDTWKVVGKFGVIGNLVSGIGRVVTGDGDAKTYIDLGKYVVKTLETGAKAVSKCSTAGDWAKHLTGFNNGMSGLNVTTPGTTFTSSISKQIKDFGNVGTKVSDKVALGAKWVGNVLTIATNGVENYEECKEGKIDAERAVRETVVESAVDIGLGIGATALVSAGLVAAGVTAAPALAVGALAVGVTWAANGVCKFATGMITGEQKDIGELVADGLCDLEDKAREFKKDVGKAAVSVAKDVGEAAISVVKDVGKSVSNAAKNVGKSFGNAVKGLSTKWKLAW